MSKLEKMKVIVTGSTGMLGKGVLYECLDSPDVKEVLSISRKALDITHPKLKELIHKDFSEFESVNVSLKDYDACFFCMGVSAGEVSAEQYKILTYDYTMNLARTLFNINPDMTFNYISGQGTDSSERGRVMWARVKGKTENDLLNLGFKQAFMFRPGGIIPRRGIKPSSKLYRRMLFWIGWLLWVVKFLAPGSIVDTTQIGKAMINVTLKGYNKKVLSPADIQVLSKI